METREQTRAAATGGQRISSEQSKSIQEQAARLPSDAFIYAAGGSIVASLTLKMIGRDKDALFVGQWAPTFLALGLFSKLVRLFGEESK